MKKYIFLIAKLIEGRLLQMYGSSIVKMVQDIYKTQKWDPTKFKQVPNGYWNNLENCEVTEQILDSFTLILKEKAGRNWE